MKIQCDLCEEYVHFGNGRYEGKPSQYSQEIFFCQNCRDVHWDGVGPIQEAKFTAVLKGKNIPLPERNGKYLFPLL